MTFNVTESSTWETNVVAPQTTDPVSGGSTGTVSLGLQDLANRTKYLKDQDFTDRKNYVERVSGDKCTLLIDDNGIEHLMYKLRRFNTSHLIGSASDDWHPAFYDSGSADHDIIYVGVHAIGEGVDGDFTSEPSKFHGIAGYYTFANAKTQIATMGTGWHLMNIYEWAALAIESATKIQYLPGATYNQKFVQDHNSSDDYHNGGHPYLYDVENPIIPGSGGRFFNHDQTAWGVADLVGNTDGSAYGQYLDLIKLEDGQIYLSSNRDNDYDEAEGSWTATGIYIDDDGAGGLQLNTSSSVPTTGQGADFVDIEITSALKAAGNSIVDSKLITEILLSRRWNNSGSLDAIDYINSLIGKRNIDIESGTKYLCAGGKTIKDNTLSASPTDDAGLAALESIDSTDHGIIRVCYIEP